MRLNAIEINADNLNDYLGLEIVAFKYTTNWITFYRE